MSDRPLMSWRPLVAALFLSTMMIAAIVIVLAFCGVSYAAGPIHAKGGRTPCQTLSACHHAIAWQRHDRAHLRHLVAVHWRRDASYAIHLSAAAFGINERDMRTVAWCESRMGAQTYAEPGSHASGLFQFLPSTWQHTPYASFDVFDPLPNALAAAQIVAHDGSWGQWTCRP